ncbi:hypothetical protein PPERSA_03916 [Pseudocohnilembus persalinus]|uniref:Uncharacterized protein n=1 Tax=Pseudocohnilembus persalinus TaxID=266149 RepID=A0A0V0Q965_PSEPJ|nr:hypothetical protein PPERSA_03916 [Pseudocohnilembus persalinus]|eukprot:KRW98781.1 hypothetical protein PPERSA_03916 [Pseudocohnilembus persalinus]
MENIRQLEKFYKMILERMEIEKDYSQKILQENLENLFEKFQQSSKHFQEFAIQSDIASINEANPDQMKKKNQLYLKMAQYFNEQESTRIKYTQAKESHNNLLLKVYQKITQINKRLKQMNIQRSEFFKDMVNRIMVSEVSYIRNMQYDADQLLNQLETSDKQQKQIKEQIEKINTPHEDEMHFYKQQVYYHPLLVDKFETCLTNLCFQIYKKSYSKIQQAVKQAHLGKSPQFYYNQQAIQDNDHIQIQNQEDMINAFHTIGEDLQLEIELKDVKSTFQDFCCDLTQELLINNENNSQNNEKNSNNNRNNENQQDMKNNSKFQEFVEKTKQNQNKEIQLLINGKQFNQDQIFSQIYDIVLMIFDIKKYDQKVISQYLDFCSFFRLLMIYLIESFRIKNKLNLQPQLFDKLSKQFIPLFIEKSYQHQEIKLLQRIFLMSFTMYKQEKQENQKDKKIYVQDLLTSLPLIQNQDIWEAFIYYTIQSDIIKKLKMDDEGKYPKDKLENMMHSTLFTVALQMIKFKLNIGMIKRIIAKFGQNFGLSDQLIISILNYIEEDDKIQNPQNYTNNNNSNNGSNQSTLRTQSVIQMPSNQNNNNINQVKNTTLNFNKLGINNYSQIKETGYKMNKNDEFQPKKLSFKIQKKN